MSFLIKYSCNIYDERHKTLKKAQARGSWWQEEDVKHTPKTASCTSMMDNYALPKKSAVRFEVTNPNETQLYNHGKYC